MASVYVHKEKFNRVNVGFNYRCVCTISEGFDLNAETSLTNTDYKKNFCFSHRRRAKLLSIRRHPTKQASLLSSFDCKKSINYLFFLEKSSKKKKCMEGTEKGAGVQLGIFVINTCHDRQSTVRVSGHRLPLQTILQKRAVRIMSRSAFDSHNDFCLKNSKF